MRRIVIVGGGYGGVWTAKQLARRLRRSEEVEIVLVDRNPYHTLMTELHEIAGARTEPGSVQINFRRVFEGSTVRVITDEIEAIDFENQELRSTHELLSYDYLVLGTGGNPDFFGIPGVQESCFTLWSLEDALRIRRHVEAQYRLAAKEPELERRQQLLHFVIAGAGFTGVELAGELAEGAKVLARQYHIDPKEIKITIVEAQSTLLAVLDRGSQAKAKRRLERMGIELIFGAPIVKAEGNLIHLKSGQVLDAGTFVWTCGVQASNFTSKIGLVKGQVANDQCSVASAEGVHGLAGCRFDDDEVYIVGQRGRIVVNSFLQAADYQNVYLVGDVIWFVYGQKLIPQVVETALQSAETVAHNILCDLRKEPKKPFEPVYHGFMVSIGAKYAVAHVMGMSLSGWFAMAMKHLVNLHYLWGLAGWNTCAGYLREEFMAMRHRRSMIGGQAAAKVSAFWLLPLRLAVGIQWLSQAIHKVAEGWLVFDKVRIPGATPALPAAAYGAPDATASASLPEPTAIPNLPVAAPPPEALAAASTLTDQATTVASQTPPEGFFGTIAGAIDSVAHWLIPKEPWPIYSWFAHTVLSLAPYLFQALIVGAEAAIGLALLSGTFTWAAAAASIGLCAMFVVSAMTDVSIYWFVMAGLALMGGAGRVLGLDYWIMPWLKDWWNRRGLAKRSHLYIGEPRSKRTKS